MNNVSRGLKKFHNGRKKAKAEILSDLHPYFEYLLRKKGLAGKYILVIKRKKTILGKQGRKMPFKKGVKFK